MEVQNLWQWDALWRGLWHYRLRLVPDFVQFGHRGVHAAFHRAHRNAECFGRLPIFELLKIDQLNHVAQRRRQLLHRLVQPVAPLARAEQHRWGWLLAGEQVEQLANILALLRAGTVEADHAMPPTAALGID